MRIKAIISQSRRDFTADYVCESCGVVKRGHGYDDQFFHAQVIPSMVCEACGAKGSGQTSTPTVPAWVVL